MLSCLTACQEKEVMPEKGPGISLSATPSVFPVEGGSQQLYVKSGASWKAEMLHKADQWLTLSPTTGTMDEHDLNITVQPNELDVERNTRVKLTNTYSWDNMEFNVTQKQKDCIALTSNKLEIPDNGGDIRIELLANMDVEYTIDASCQSWVHERTYATRAMRRQFIDITIDPNSTWQSREGIIVLRAGQATETINIYQQGKISRVVLSCHDVSVRSCRDTFQIEVEHTVPYDYILPDGVDWITEPETRAVSYTTHYFVASENPDRQPRQADIIFVNLNNDQTDTVHVVQVERDALVAAQREYDLSDAAQYLPIRLNTSSKLSATSSCEWIRMTKMPDTSTIDDTFSVYDYLFFLDGNNDEKPRQGSITFTTSNGASQVIIVRQDGLQHTMSVSIQNNTFTLYAPQLTGNNAWGRIKWGDGKEEPYAPNLVHQFDDDTPRTTYMEFNGTNEITIHDIKDINHITFHTNGESTGITETFKTENVEWQ